VRSARFAAPDEAAFADIVDERVTLDAAPVMEARL